MNSSGMRIAAMIALALGTMTTYLLFILRYGWYTTPSQAHSLNIGLVFFAFVCCLAWFAKPSKTLVLAGYALLFAGPPIYDATHFVALDMKIVPFLVIGTIPLVAAIEMRRRTWRQQEQ